MPGRLILLSGTQLHILLKRSEIGYYYDPRLLTESPR